MVQPIEAKGRKSICLLLDTPTWPAAKARLMEIGIRLRYSKSGRPIVNIEQVNKASQRWQSGESRRSAR